MSIRLQPNLDCHEAGDEEDYGEYKQAVEYVYQIGKQGLDDGLNPRIRLVDLAESHNQIAADTQS